MRRRRATHMQAVEEEVERLSNENSLLLHRMSQLVASHQQVDSENQQLRHELQCLRQSVVTCPPCTCPCVVFHQQGQPVTLPEPAHFSCHIGHCTAYLDVAARGCMSRQVILCTNIQERVLRQRQIAQVQYVRREHACKWGRWTWRMPAWLQLQRVEPSRHPCWQHRASWLSSPQKCPPLVPAWRSVAS